MLGKTFFGLMAMTLAVTVPAAAKGHGSDQPAPAHNASFAVYSGLTCYDPNTKDYMDPHAPKTVDPTTVKAYHSDSTKGSSPNDPFGHAGMLTNSIKAEYVASGPGACGFYRDTSMTACLNWNWTLPGRQNLPVDNATRFPCNTWVEVNYNGKKIQARVQDKCPGAGCDGIWLSKRAFGLLAGSEGIKAGSLPPGSLDWKFLNRPPCWAAWGGIGGNTLDGNVDKCEPGTFDDYGNVFDGLKTGSDRVVGPAVAEKCPATGSNGPNVPDAGSKGGDSGSKGGDSGSGTKNSVGTKADCKPGQSGSADQGNKSDSPAAPAAQPQRRSQSGFRRERA
ncbi:uncharacterized protein PFL1_01998 [Pseudozyma flocculosa PF-1]|uniref:Secreted protein n=1 Tax=Pseudozyma flocculosa TaxID=84751 RepID=A0A5C3F0E2_9BASI|nr:uncharacterized protein PFL1_01998 [Pseudozyma flocculosa PF-1]EPQ30472.1 hypothetical protein PFL1_01998 [Pseudozyma flocculosa PF-1]SPO37555.1 uncharacterized protein PSFLO_03030 [Pseudozyma flocculosa]